MTLREIRFYNRLTQIELAQKSGIHQSTLCHIEKGRIKATEKQKNKIAKALNIETEMIQFDIEPK